MTIKDEQDIGSDDVGNLPAVPVDDAKVLAEFKEYANSIAVEDPEVVQERILRNLLTATTAADILRAGEALPASALYGVPLSIRSIRASESTFEDGADLYLHIDATVISNGDQVTFSCGASDVCVKLIRLDQLGMLPVSARIEQAAKPTKAGFYPVFLRALDAEGEPF